MIATTINDKGVTAMLNAIGARGKRPPVQKIGTVMLKSVMRNFHEGGRPTRWPDLAESTKARRGESAKPLMDTGTMRNANEVHIPSSDSVGVRNQTPYAAYHHGDDDAPVGLAVAQGRKVPARPFMVIQDEDISDICKMLAGHLVRGR